MMCTGGQVLVSELVVGILRSEKGAAHVDMWTKCWILCSHRTTHIHSFLDVWFEGVVVERITGLFGHCKLRESECPSQLTAKR